MDLVDLMEEKRFLGQEFLTWLWWKSEERGGSILLPGQGDIAVIFEKHMLLEYGEGDSSEKLVCSGLQSELQEAERDTASMRQSILQTEREVAESHEKEVEARSALAHTKELIEVKVEK